MTKTVQAIYEDGVFKPEKKLKLPEHERFMLTIAPLEEKAIQRTVEMQKRALKKLIGIGRGAAADVSVHHDRYLYKKDR